MENGRKSEGWEIKLQISGEFRKNGDGTLYLSIGIRDTFKLCFNIFLRKNVM